MIYRIGKKGKLRFVLEVRQVTKRFEAIELTLPLPSRNYRLERSRQKLTSTNWTLIDNVEILHDESLLYVDVHTPNISHYTSAYPTGRKVTLLDRTFAEYKLEGLYHWFDLEMIEIAKSMNHRFSNVSFRYGEQGFKTLPIKNGISRSGSVVYKIQNMNKLNQDFRDGSVISQSTILRLIRLKRIRQI